MCRIKGIFETGSEVIDTYFLQMPIKYARRLFRMPPMSATQMGVILRNPDRQNRILHKVKKYSYLMRIKKKII